MTSKMARYLSPSIKAVGSKYPLVEITWNDAWSGAGWHHDPTHEPLTCITVGYMIKNNDMGCMVATTLDEKGVTGGVSFRPAGMIIGIRVIQKAQK